MKGKNQYHRETATWGEKTIAPAVRDEVNESPGQWVRLKAGGAMFRGLNALGTLFAPLQGPISSGLDRVIEKLQRLPDFMAEMSVLFGPAMSNLGAIFGPLAQQIGSALGTALGLAREALAALAPHFENLTAFLRDNKEIVALFATIIGGFVVSLGWETGAIQLMTVANNLLRASFLGHGGDFKLVQNHGTDGQVGKRKVGRTLRFRGPAHRDVGRHLHLHGPGTEPGGDTWTGWRWSWGRPIPSGRSAVPFGQLRSGSPSGMSISVSGANSTGFRVEKRPSGSQHIYLWAVLKEGGHGE